MDLIGKLECARKDYSDLWNTVIRDWNNLKSKDAVWLTYAANYLLFTGGMRWAIDPFSMSTRISGVPQPDFAADLKNLEFVAFTHAHNDHLDLKLVNAIAHLPIKWIIPQHTLDKILKNNPISLHNVIIPENGVKIKLGAVSLTPFDSLHFHELGGIAETGYLAEFNGKRWLFPGDIRKFDVNRLPAFEKLDGIFAHLWLGKGHAKDAQPPYLFDFANFFTTLAPSKLIITHLDEFGRSEDELWDEKHYMMAAKKIHAFAPSISVNMAKMGMKVFL